MQDFNGYGKGREKYALQHIRERSISLVRLYFPQILDKKSQLRFLRTCGEIFVTYVIERKSGGARNRVLLRLRWLGGVRSGVLRR